MTHILVIWTIIAAGAGGAHHDYRPIGEFANEDRCVVAGKQLKVTKDRPFICLKK